MVVQNVHKQSRRKLSSKRAVRRHKTSRYNKKKPRSYRRRLTGGQMTAADDCPICLDKLDRGDVINTDADHLFHAQCLVALFKANPNFVCPMCRGPVYPETRGVLKRLSVPNELREWYYFQVPQRDHNGIIYRRLFTQNPATGFYVNNLIEVSERYGDEPWFISIQDDRKKIVQYPMANPRPERGAPRNADQLALEHAYNQQEHANAQYIMYYMHNNTPWSPEDHPRQTIFGRLFGR